LTKRIVIIGGGISGLATAYALQERLSSFKDQAACYLIEGSKRPGGVILTETVDGFVIDGGPESFLSTKPWALELCQRLGLTNRLVGTCEDQKKTYIFSRGKLHELPEGLTLMVPTRIKPFLQSGLISLSGKLRMGMDLFLPSKVGDEDESMGSFVRRRLGQEILERLAEPLMGGIYAGDANQISLKTTFPNFLTLEKEYGSVIRGMWSKRKEARKHLQEGASSKWTMFVTLRGGLTELIQTLVAKLDRVSLMTDNPVIRLHPSANSSSQQSVYTITLAKGESIQADVIILTTPSYKTANLLEELSPLLSTRLREIPYVSTATVSLGYKKSDFSHPPYGFGFVIPRVENRKIIASTWTSNKFPYRAPNDGLLLRCYMSQTSQKDLMSLDDSTLVQIAREELKVIVGITQEPILTRIYRWEKAMPQYLVGHLDRLAKMEGLLSNYPGLFLTGSAYRGVGIPDCIYSGTLTAENVLRYLCR
jgi:oxygen-dependent protoporphyrinogen oxidase